MVRFIAADNTDKLIPLITLYKDYIKAEDDFLSRYNGDFWTHLQKVDSGKKNKDQLYENDLDVIYHSKECQGTVGYLREKTNIINCLFSEELRPKFSEDLGVHVTEELKIQRNKWLLSILSILEAENNKFFLDMIMTNMSGMTYEEFKAIYTKIVEKERSLAKKVEISGKNDPRITNLQRLRASMVKRIIEKGADDDNYRLKISFCLRVETCLTVTAKILERIARSKKKYGFAIPRESLIIIESLEKNYKAFGLTKDSRLVKLTQLLLYGTHKNNTHKNA